MCDPGCYKAFVSLSSNLKFKILVLSLPLTFLDCCVKMKQKNIAQGSFSHEMNMICLITVHCKGRNSE